MYQELYSKRLFNTPSLVPGQIDNSSGHYTPSKDQLVIATKYLSDCGVLDDNFILTGFGLNGNYNLNELNVFTTGEILENYDELPQ